MTMPAYFESLVDSFDNTSAERSQNSLALRLWQALIKLRENQARTYLRTHCHLLDRLDRTEP